MSIHPSRFRHAINETASGGVDHPLPTAPVQSRDGTVDNLVRGHGTDRHAEEQGDISALR